MQKLQEKAALREILKNGMDGNNTSSLTNYYINLKDGSWGLYDGSMMDNSGKIYSNGVDNELITFRTPTLGDQFDVFKEEFKNKDKFITGIFKKINTKIYNFNVMNNINQSLEFLEKIEREKPLDKKYENIDRFIKDLEKAKENDSGIDLQYKGQMLDRIQSNLGYAPSVNLFYPEVLEKLKEQSETLKFEELKRDNLSKDDYKYLLKDDKTLYNHRFDYFRDKVLPKTKNLFLALYEIEKESLIEKDYKKDLYRIVEKLDESENFIKDEWKLSRIDWALSIFSNLKNDFDKIKEHKTKEERKEIQKLFIKTSHKIRDYGMSIAKNKATTGYTLDELSKFDNSFWNSIIARNKNTREETLNYIVNSPKKTIFFSDYKPCRYNKI